MAIRLNDNYLRGFILDQEYTAIQPQVSAAHKMLVEKSGLGNDFLGWLDLPVAEPTEEMIRVQAAADRFAYRFYRYTSL